LSAERFGGTILPAMTLALSPSVVPSIHRYTAEEFLELPDHRGFELIDGALDEIPMGSEAGWVAGEIFGYFDGEDMLQGFRVRLSDLFQPVPG
jgi:hypothetical protein